MKLVPVALTLLLRPASGSTPPTSADLAVLNAPGASGRGTLTDVGRALDLLRRDVDTIFKNSTSLARSWNGAVLFSLERSAGFGATSADGTGSVGINVVCTTCYFTANATATLTLAANVNWTDTLDRLDSSTHAQFVNITGAVARYVDAEFTAFVNNSANHVDELFGSGDGPEADAPPLDIDFNIPIEALPGATLRIDLDGLELYIQMDTVLGGAVVYTVPLFSSSSPLGLAEGGDLLVGVVFAVDLILSAEAELDMSSGVHVRLDDSAFLEIAMFGRNVSNMNFPGGSVEFLPVTVTSATATLSAILQLSIHAGLNVGIDLAAEFRASAGIEVSVFANLAEFVTTITADSRGGDSGRCHLNVEEFYQLAVGAAAGATVALNDKSWGPDPETTIAVWTSTIQDGCAAAATAAPTPLTVAVAARADGDSEAVTATTETTLTLSGVVCLSSLAQCPASLQSHTVRTTVQTLTTVVPPGVRPSWPATAVDSVASLIPFGSAVKDMFAVSGTPTPYTGGGGGGGSGGGGIVDQARDKIEHSDQQVVVGVSVGVGVVALLATAGVAAFCVRRSKRRAAAAAAARYKTRGLPVAPALPDSYYDASHGSGGYGARSAGKSPAQIAIRQTRPR